MKLGVSPWCVLDRVSTREILKLIQNTQEKRFSDADFDVVVLTKFPRTIAHVDQRTTPKKHVVPKNDIFQNE